MKTRRNGKEASIGHGRVASWETFREKKSFRHTELDVDDSATNRIQICQVFDEDLILGFGHLDVFLEDLVVAIDIDFMFPNFQLGFGNWHFDLVFSYLEMEIFEFEVFRIRISCGSIDFRFREFPRSTFNSNHQCADFPKYRVRTEIDSRSVIAHWNYTSRVKFLEEVSQGYKATLRKIH